MVRALPLCQKARSEQVSDSQKSEGPIRIPLVFLGLRLYLLFRGMIALLIFALFCFMTRDYGLVQFIVLPIRFVCPPCLKAHLILLVQTCT